LLVVFLLDLWKNLEWTGLGWKKSIWCSRTLSDPTRFSP